MKRPVALGFTDGAGFGVRQRNERAKRIKFSEIREGAYSGRARVPYMDLLGLRDRSRTTHLLPHPYVA
jgi:hypothetical protein